MRVLLIEDDSATAQSIELMLNVPATKFFVQRLDPSPLLDMASTLAALDARDDPKTVKIVTIKHRQSRFRILSEWTETWLLLKEKKLSADATTTNGSGLSGLGLALLQAYRGEDTVGAQLKVLDPLVTPGFRNAVADLTESPYVDTAEPLPLGQEFVMRVYFMTLTRVRKENAENDDYLLGVKDAVTGMVGALGHQVGLDFPELEVYSQLPFSRPVLDALVKLWTQHCNPQSLHGEAAEVNVGLRAPVLSPLEGSTQCEHHFRCVRRQLKSPV